MDKARILKALLWIIQENGGLLHEVGGWLGELKKAGYIETELWQVDGCNLPHWVLTEKGEAKL